LKRKKRLFKQQETKEKEEQIKPEQVEPHPLDYLTDLIRGYKGKPALSTANLEMLAKAQHIADYVDENDDLMLNPEKMRALRTLLLQ
jgi:hypothetical protein